MNYSVVGLLENMGVAFAQRTGSDKNYHYFNGKLDGEYWFFRQNMDGAVYGKQEDAQSWVFIDYMN